MGLAPMSWTPVEGRVSARQSPAMEEELAGEGGKTAVLALEDVGLDAMEEMSGWGGTSTTI